MLTEINASRPVSQTNRQQLRPESFTCCSSQTVHINISLQRWQFSSFSRTLSSELSLQLNNQVFASRWRTLHLIWCLAPVWELTLQFFYSKKKDFSRIRSFHGFHLLCSPTHSVNQLKADWTFLSTHKDEKWSNNKKLLPGGVFSSMVRFQFENFEHLYFPFTTVIFRVIFHLSPDNNLGNITNSQKWNSL